MTGRIRGGLLRLLLASFLLLPVCLPGVLSAAETGVVEEVPDGDTLRVRVDGAAVAVRLIGIDAPERSHPTKGKEFFGDEAAEHLSSLCLGKTVRMEKGEEEADRYDRLLRYVYLSPPDGRLLNLEMLRAGMARAYARFPFSRRDEFLAAEARARREARGLWKDGGLSEARWLASGNGRSVEVFPAGGGDYVVSHKGWFLDGVKRQDLAKEIDWVLKNRAELSEAEFSRRAMERGYRPLDPAPFPAADPARLRDASPARGAEPVSWEEADRHVDERVLVEGTIVRTHRTATMLYLNFHANWKRYLTVVIHAKDLPLFPEDPENRFKGKRVRVRGEIVRYKGRLEMTVRDPLDLVIVP